MRWNDLPLWAKYGFIFSVIMLVTFLTFSYSVNRLFSGESLLGFLGIFLYALPLIIVGIGFLVPEQYTMFVSSIVIFTVYFIIGALIGLIVKKLKSK